MKFGDYLDLSVTQSDSLFKMTDERKQELLVIVKEAAKEIVETSVDGSYTVGKVFECIDKRTDLTGFAEGMWLLFKFKSIIEIIDDIYSEKLLEDGLKSQGLDVSVTITNQDSDGIRE